MELPLHARKGQGEPVLKCNFHPPERVGREGGRLSLVSGDRGPGQRARLTERTALAGEARQLDLEDHTGTIWAGQGVHIALDIASIGIGALGKGSVRHRGLVHSSDRVVADNCSISKFLRRG